MSEASATEPNAAPEAPDEAGTMAKAYQPTSVEPAVQRRWLAADVFAPDGGEARGRDAREGNQEIAASLQDGRTVSSLPHWIFCVLPVRPLKRTSSLLSKSLP